MTKHYYTVGTDRFEGDDCGAAAAAATARRARLVHHWETFTGWQKEDTAVPYPVLRETPEHLWVDSPIGVIGIPALRSHDSQRASEVPATAVHLSVSEFRSGPGVQVSFVIYANGKSSAYAGTCFTAGELTREGQKSQIAEQMTLIDALLSAIPDCTSSGYDWDAVGVLDPEYQRPVSHVSLPTSENPAFAGLSFGFSGWTEHRTLDGRTCYQHSIGNACVLHAPRDVVERAWAARAEKTQLTREQAERQLTEYGPERAELVAARARAARGEQVSQSDLMLCAGWELHAWICGRADLLEKYGQK